MEEGGADLPEMMSMDQTERAFCQQGGASGHFTASAVQHVGYPAHRGAVEVIAGVERGQWKWL